MEEEKVEIFLTDEEAAVTARYSPDFIAHIDHALIAETGEHWRKSARVIAYALKDFPNVPEAYFVDRIMALVSKGELMSQGNLRLVRLSEVRRFPKAN